MRKFLFVLLVFISSTASAQNWRFQNSLGDAVFVGFEWGGADPQANFFALLNNDNDFDVRATLSLETDLQEYRREIEIVIPAGACYWKVPFGMFYTRDWIALMNSRSGARIDLVIHEPRLTRKLWTWLYLPGRMSNANGNLYPHGMETGNGHYFYD